MANDDSNFFIESNSVNALLYSKMNDENAEIMHHMQNEILILYQLIKEIKDGKESN